MVHLRQGVHKGINFIPGIHLGHSEKHVILKGWIILSQVVTADETMFEKVIIDLGYWFQAADGKLMKEG
jgi:hypothetical protein